MLALKGNQGTRHDDVRRFLDDSNTTRTATVSADIAWLQESHKWPGLAAIGKVVRIRETAEKTTTDTACYLLSTALSPERFNDVVRSHWGVENGRWQGFVRYPHTGAFDTNPPKD